MQIVHSVCNKKSGVKMLNDALSLLEFDKIREKVSKYTVSSYSRAKILSELPSYNYGDIVYLQNLTKEACIVAEKYASYPIVAFDEIDEIVEKAKKEALLQCNELLKIARILKAGRIAQSSILSCGDDVILLKKLVEGLLIDESLERDIGISIIGENEISDNASDKLKSIRRKIVQTNVKLKEKLASYTRNNDVSTYLQDNLVTIRNNRFVLPVKAAFKGSVPGLVHDQSSTGSTVFIEPFAVVELNNELRTLQAEELAEIEKILIEFTKRVSSNAEMICLCEEACAEIDVIFAKYTYSIKNKCVEPQISRNGIVKLTNARHPLLDKTKVVPISIEIGTSFDVLLITGPNTGGKTVSLKTVGLFSLMAYFGLWLPCDEGCINVFDGIYCDIGDNQSIDNELSTFSSHVTKIIRITEEINENSLVLLDELGGGTDPTEGAALALGIIDYIRQIKAKAIITTHYNELKEYGLVNSRITNASMQFNSETFAPTYKLLLGTPGTSNALNIASRLGINPQIIKKAEENLNKDKQEFENLLKNAERIQNKAIEELEIIKQEKNEILQEKAKINADSKRLESLKAKIQSNATAETRRLVSNSMSKADEIIEKMQELLEQTTEGALLEAKKLRHKLSDIEDEMNKEEDFTQYIPLKKDEIKVNSPCVVMSLKTNGTIKSTVDKNGMVFVSFGNISTKVKWTDLGVSIEKPAKKPVIYTTKREKTVTTFLTELKVLGMTIDEAISVIEPYLISMHENEGNKTIKIVHGKGTMALAKGLHRYFKNMPIVEEFRFGRYGEGDNGVTFVTVK